MSDSGRRYNAASAWVYSYNTYIIYIIYIYCIQMVRNFGSVRPRPLRGVDCGAR